MLLDIKNLKVNFHTRVGIITVIDDFNMEIAKGEKVGIIGESGSGKTSLALSIMGLNEGEVEGSIKFQGEELITGDNDYDNNKEKMWNRIRGKKISMVFQNTGEVLNPVYTLIDQVMEPYLELYPDKKEEAFQKASHLLDKLGLEEEHYYSYPFYLSGGEVQKGLFAMALINDPDLLILDEPTSALDVITEAQLITFLEEILGKEKTVMVISHDLSTVAQLTERTTVLYAGAKLESGPTLSVLKDPRHPYTRALVRSYPTGERIKDLQGIRGKFPSFVDLPEGCRFYGRCTQSLEICKNKRPPVIKTENETSRLLACHRGGIVTLLKGQGLTKTYSRKIKSYNNNNSRNIDSKDNFSLETSSDVKEEYFDAVNDVNIDLKEGEVLTLVGESGSGKTTLGHILAGMNEPTVGEVYFNNNEFIELYSLKNQERKMIRQYLQLLFQNPHKAVSHRLMVHDIVEEPLKIQGVKDKEDRGQRVKKALELAGLTVDSFFTHKYPHELSGGELQRVTIARALVLEPRVLIADEPSAALDASVQAKILKLLLHLQNEQGFSLFLITHDIALAGKVGDQVGVMFDGKIVEKGPVTEIFNYPGHPYTKTLLSLAPSLEPRGYSKAPRFDKIKPPDLAEIREGIQGCSYYPYCAEAEERCQAREPQVKSIGFREVACHMVKERLSDYD